MESFKLKELEQQREEEEAAAALKLQKAEHTRLSLLAEDAAKALAEVLLVPQRLPLRLGLRPGVDQENRRR